MGFSVSTSRTGNQRAVRIRLLRALRVGRKHAVIVVAAVAVTSSVVIAKLLLGLCPLHDVFHSEAHLEQPL